MNVVKDWSHLPGGRVLGIRRLPMVYSHQTQRDREENRRLVSFDCGMKVRRAGEKPSQMKTMQDEGTTLEWAGFY